MLRGGRSESMPGMCWKIWVMVNSTMGKWKLRRARYHVDESGSMTVSKSEEKDEDAQYILMQ